LTRTIFNIVHEETGLGIDGNNQSLPLPHILALGGFVRRESHQTSRSIHLFETHHEGQDCEHIYFVNVCTVAVGQLPKN
jgi:hypothetical protein